MATKGQARLARFNELGGTWDALNALAEEEGCTARNLKKQLRRMGAVVPDGRTDGRVKNACSRDGCDGAAKGRGLCAAHYRQWRSEQGLDRVTRNRRNAEVTMMRGGVPQPPISLPFRPIARTCRKCGDLVTTPAHRLRKGSGPLPRCPKCAIEEVSAYQKKRRAVDAEYDQRVRELARRASRKSIDKNQAETLPTASRNGHEWTGPELELVLREDLTVKEISLMIGRTFAATAHARHRARTDPKFIRLAGVVDGDE